MRTLLPDLKHQWRALAGTFAVATLARLLMLADPQILRMIVDRYVMHAATMPRPQFVRGVLILTAAAVAVGLLARTFRTLQEYSIALVARRVGARLYAKSVAHSLLLPYKSYEKQRSGEVLHIIQRARVDAENGISGAVRLYLGALAIVAVTIYAFTVHPVVGLVHLVGIPLSAVAMLAVSAPIRRRQREIATQTAALAGSATEAIRNLELVKSLGIETQEIGRLENVNDRILGLEEAKLRLIRLFTLFEGLLFHGVRAVLLLVMLWFVYERSITTGEFLTLFLYTSAIFPAIGEASVAVSRYQEARASFDTLDVVLDQAKEARPADGKLLDAIESVAFDHVSLRYDGTERPALDDITLALRVGQTVAFAGPSGAGKSSLVKLLVGLYTPTAGALRINEHDLRALDLDAYRGRVGLVTQETMLFAGTIRENLQIAKPDASDAECTRALEHAAAPFALDAVIGEGGLKLSGGEKQRIAIARALLRNPDLLVFDEATSNLDSLTERAITDTIRGLAGATRLTILVAHRLSTLAHADRIHVLDRGAIVEAGTHDELLARGGLYASLWREQT